MQGVNPQDKMFKSTPSMQRETNQVYVSQTTKKGFKSTPSMQRETVPDTNCINVELFKSTPSMQRETICYLGLTPKTKCLNPLPLCRGRPLTPFAV